MPMTLLDKKHHLVHGMFSPALPARALDTHKGNNGSIAVIGGDTGMVGAVLLASRAALLSGAGRVYAAILSTEAPAVDLNYPEIMMHSASTITNLSQLNCIVIGPGLGKTNTAINLLEFCISQNPALLIDADALNLIATHPYLSTLIKNRQAETVITPHPGEAARLLNCTTKTIQRKRVVSALKLADSLHASCVLKGAGSICAHHDGTWYINTTGNAGLATGGTGDVLAGIIGSLIAQGLSALDAVKLGVYAHGAAADSLVNHAVGPIGMTASELTQEVRNVLNKLNNNEKESLNVSLSKE